MTTSIENAFRALVNGNTGTVSNGIAGTNNDIRSIVWEAFRTKYNTDVEIMVSGVVITLKAHHSISGKSTSYTATLTDEQYVTINGSDFGLSKRKDAYITIQIGIVEVHGGGNYFRKIENNKIYFNHE